MPKRDNIIAFTYGEPCGIGPEILFKALAFRQNFIPLIYADEKKISNNNFLNFIKVFKPGKPTVKSAKHTLKSLEFATLAGFKKEYKYLITGPVSKENINKISKSFSGQTDEMARLCNIDKNKVIMTFISKDLRIALFTRHIPIQLISSHLSKKKIIDFILTLNSELNNKFKIKKPKIAVLGLNPHAGENGVIGLEEKNIIKPAIKHLNKIGLSVFGPFSPDATLAEAGQNYLKNKKQKYDIYVSMYHDQCLPMFKAVSGREGLNITLGLPFLRLSPDHGTAFDIAGKNIADPIGIISAVKFIQKLTSSN